MTAEERSNGAIGIAPLGDVCGDYRQSINEEAGGFLSINTVAHEMGHK